MFQNANLKITQGTDTYVQTILQKKQQQKTRLNSNKKDKRERKRERKNKMSLQSHSLFNKIDQSFRQLYLGRNGQCELNSRKYNYNY